MADLPSGWRTWLGNLALAALSVAATLLAVELVLVPLLLDRLPLGAHGRVVNRAVRMLAQSSKAGVLPQDYVALVGDSYAEGEGDWHLGADPRSNGPFHSAHLIHARTGRDVVSFGHAGAGSLRALVTEPTARLAYLARTARFEIEPPSDVLIYFYEGNDLDDNLEDLAQRFDPRFGRESLRDPGVFARFLEDVVLGEDRLLRKAQGFRFGHNFYLLRSLRWALARSGIPREAADWREVQLEPRVASGRGYVRGNHFLVAGEPVTLRLPLQSPALELDEQETDDALWGFRESAQWLAGLLPEARLAVAYLPSPLASYRLDAEVVVVQEDHHRAERPTRFPAAAVLPRSDALCRRVAAAAGEAGMAFRDVRPELRAAAAGQAIHGPRDWKHLNRAGYEALAGAVVPLLAGEQRPCVSLGDDEDH